MASDEFAAYQRAARNRGDVDAEERIQNVLDFGNEALTPAVWAHVEQHGGIARFEKPDEDDPVAAERGPDAAVTFRWLLHDPNTLPHRTVPRGRKGLAVARKLQREMSGVLAGLVRGDSEPADRFVASGGVYRCRVVERRKSNDGPNRKDDGVQGPWEFSWEPTRIRGARAILLSHMDDVLRYAERIARCERCSGFYLRTGRWVTRKRRFCSEPCSVAFHNAEKVAAKSKERQKVREARSVARAAARATERH